MQRILLLILITFSTLSPIKAQHLPGAALGNYSGTQALFHNPAFVSDSRYSVYGNLVGTQFYMANNHIRYNLPYSMFSLMTGNVSDKHKSEQGKIYLDRPKLEPKLNNRLKHLNAGGDTRLPSLMVSLKDGRFGVAITTRARYMLNLSKTTQGMAELLRAGLHSPILADAVATNQSGKVHLNLVGEIGLTLGGVVINNETDFLKAGVSIKRMIGLYNAHIELDNANYEIKTDPNYPNQVPPNRPRQLATMTDVRGFYGYTSDAAIRNFTFTPGWLFGNAPAGTGYGLDLGVVYEYRPDIRKYTYSAKGTMKQDASKNKYLYRLAVSVTDIGKIAYKNPYYVVRQEVQSSNGIIDMQTFRDSKGIEGFFNSVDGTFDTNPGLRSYTFSSKLPMALQASVDYNVKPSIYISAMWVQSLRSQGSMGMKSESVLAVTPRYENKWYELSVPVSLMNRYGSFGVGLAGRAGPFWFGTDHLAGFFNIGKPKMFNFYAGISTGLYRRPPETPNPCYPRQKTSLFRRMFLKK